MTSLTEPELLQGAIYDVVLEARPWPRGASRPNFMALALALRAVLTIFDITLKVK